MDPQPEINMKIAFKNYRKIKDRELCPTKEVDPEHFLEPDLAALLYLVQFFSRAQRSYT